LVIVFNEKKQSINKKQIEIKTIIDSNPDNLSIYTDTLRLQQILTNLIDNALKFTEEGFIEIGYRKDTDINNSSITFYVKDTGIGLTEEQKSYIFQRFGKVETDRKKLYRGAGLGLTISKNIVEMMGGKIWVESEKDKGSVFSFILPISNQNN
jgi:signal transduction histidine kinase